MSILNERIKEMRIKKGMTLFEVAEQIGVRDATVQRYESGEIKNIKYDIIVKLAQLFNCTPAFLMGWENEIQVSPINEEDFIMIPVVGRVAAGKGCYAEEDIESYEPTSKRLLTSDNKYMYVRVQGDSMMPRYLPNDLLLVQCQTSVDSGSYAVVLIDGEDGVVKKVNYGSDWIELVSENPHYPVRRFEGADVMRLRVIGLVKMMIRKET